MTHLLDSDTLSIWQFGSGPDAAMLQFHLSAHPTAQVGVSAVGLHEQALGCHTYLLGAKTTADLVRGYARWLRVVEAYRHFTTVPFDDPAGREFDRLKAARIRVGTMDLRIAAVALSRGLTVVTRNLSDFARVPNLKVEDWTK